MGTMRGKQINGYGDEESKLKATKSQMFLKQRGRGLLAVTQFVLLIRVLLFLMHFFANYHS